MCFGCILGAFWVSFGCVLSVFWVYFVCRGRCDWLRGWRVGERTTSMRGIIEVGEGGGGVCVCEWCSDRPRSRPLFV